MAGMASVESLYDALRKKHVRQKLVEGGFFFGNLENGTGTTSGPLQEIGITDGEMRSGAYQERIHPDDRPNYMRLWHRLNDGLTDELYCEYRVQGDDGSRHWLETHWC